MIIRQGSSKDMRGISPRVVEVRFTDFWSVDDRGRSSQPIPGLGASRCACAVRSFELAATADPSLPTHFIERTGETTINVEEFDVPDNPNLSGSACGRVIPREFLHRVRVFGSLKKRLDAEVITPEELGFEPGTVVDEGMPLPHPRIEWTTKFERIDRHLSPEEAFEFSGITRDQWERSNALVERAARLSGEWFDRVGYMRPDGKMELATRWNGDIVIVDAFGTQDEDRILFPGADDKWEHADKDLLRDYLEKSGWRGELKAAREMHPDDESLWPPYPTLPDELVALVSERYAQVAHRYAGA